MLKRPFLKPHNFISPKKDRSTPKFPHYSAEEAAARADLRQHNETLNVNQIGANLEAVQRMYDNWDGRIQ